MPKLIVADENEGRRKLLASTLERSGYEVTRAGTLRQAEGTALATMPEIVLVDGEWKIGDAIDASQRLMSDPEFAFKCRIVLLSRNSSEDYLISAARAGVSEVIPKPVDMSKLLSQLEKHSNKQFVAPPADVTNAAGTGKGGTFDVSMVMGDGKWALPMLKNIVTPEKINVDFINEILAQLGEEGIEIDREIDPNFMSNILRVALNSIVTDIDTSNNAKVTNKTEVLPNSKQKAKLGSSREKKKTIGSSMEDILQNQADEIANEIEGIMDQILDEKPDYVSILPNEQQIVIDPEVLKFTRLVTETAHELMWDIGKPGNVQDLTLKTRIEDLTEMLGDVLSSLPDDGEEE